MSTVNRKRTRKQVQRRIRIIRKVENGMGAIQITMDQEPHNYLLDVLASDFGAAFRLTKQELQPLDPGIWELKVTARYDVCLNEKQSTCECLGFLKRGKCKHVDGLTTLRQKNLI